MMKTNIQRRDRVNYFLDLAEAAAQSSTCIHKRCGAILVNEDIVITTGYTGAPRGRQNCIDIGYCSKECTGICRGVHAEANAALFASLKEMDGGTLYVVRILIDEEGNNIGYVESPDCCESCKMLLINSRLRDVYVRITKDEYIRQTIMDWIEHDGTLSPDVPL